MTAGRAAALALVAGVAAAGPAGADVFRSDDDRYEIDLPAGWVREGETGVWRNRDTGQSLVVTRIDGPTRDAWKGKREFFRAVEKGVRDTAKRFKLLRRRRGKQGRVPRLDLWFEYETDDGDRVAVAMRFLFFRRYALALAIDTPAERFREHRRAVRRLTKSFTPYFPSDPGP